MMQQAGMAQEEPPQTACAAVRGAEPRHVAQETKWSYAAQPLLRAVMLCVRDSENPQTNPLNRYPRSRRQQQRSVMRRLYESGQNPPGNQNRPHGERR